MRTLIFLLILSGCSVFLGTPGKPKSAKGSSYSIPFSKPGWVYKKNDKSDFVFENKDGRIILSNSFCEEFQEQPLEKLAARTFNTVKYFKPKVSEYTTFQNREAYRLEGNGSVDGVRVGLRLMNTRRNNCYFDFVAITPEDVKDDNTFNEFLSSVVFR